MLKFYIVLQKSSLLRIVLDTARQAQPFPHPAGRFAQKIFPK